ncbi:Uma2 family endonuclease [Candidatus Thiosymbion oneisti]|uniref:Uma2 family endonuclease n=1 Tax=Candidatus Thiosymbion oneisti TaxID=589554 RepID=UPI00105F6CAF|nr:Uma2 family endonuclease [Candidatus Thiosymbion oneisti]
MAEPAYRNAGYEDILALPEHRVGEIIGGELYSHPKPAPRHARAYSALGYLVGGPFDGGRNGPGGWWIIDEPEIHLAGDILVPDMAGWCRERLPVLPDSAWFELVPDWVCETLSPATKRTDRALKMPRYAREGAAHLWLVDPDTHTLEVYSLQDDRHWRLLKILKGDDEVRQPPFEAVGFSLGNLWA